MRPRAIAFQGARGAFSEEAARQLLGAAVEVLPCERFEDVFRSLKEGRVAGAVDQQLKIFFRSDSTSCSSQSLAMASSLMRRERAVSSILRSPKDRSLSDRSR